MSPTEQGGHKTFEATPSASALRFVCTLFSKPSGGYQPNSHMLRARGGGGGGGRAYQIFVTLNFFRGDTSVLTISTLDKNSLSGPCLLRRTVNSGKCYELFHNYTNSYQHIPIKGISNHSKIPFSRTIGNHISLCETYLYSHRTMLKLNQRTNGPVNAHLISEPSISINHTKPD